MGRNRTHKRLSKPAPSTEEEIDALSGKYNIVTEGLATIGATHGKVFYNKAQVVNRDISVLAISAWAKGLAREKEEKEEEKERKRMEQTVREVANIVKKKKISAEEAKKLVDEREAEEAARKLKAKQKREEIRKQKEAEEAAAGSSSSSSSSSEARSSTPSISLFEGLSASGLRALRYAAEIPELDRIVANDISEDAVAMIEGNIEYNSKQHPSIIGRVESRHGDCNQGLFTAAWDRRPYTCVDLDPFGSPTPFLESAIAAVAADGLLCVTATDMAVLAGATPDACFIKYGSSPAKGTPWVHEQGLRILLNTIAVIAARQRRMIEPVLCLSIDFYVRVFLRVRDGAALARHHASKVGMVHKCCSCPNFVPIPVARTLGDHVKANFKMKPGQVPEGASRCSECGSTMHTFGPMWLGPMQNKKFIDSVLAEIPCHRDHLTAEKRIKALLGVAKNELDDMFFFSPSDLCHFLHLEPIPLAAFKSAIVNLGYSISDTHTRAGAVKTDAGPSVIMKVLRAWAKKQPPAKGMSGPAQRFMDGGISNNNKTDINTNNDDSNDDDDEDASSSLSKKKQQQKKKEDITDDDVDFTVRNDLAGKKSNPRFCANPEGYQGGPLGIAKRKKPGDDTTIGGAAGDSTATDANTADGDEQEVDEHGQLRKKVKDNDFFMEART